LYFRTKRFKLIMRNYLVGGFQRNYEKWYTTPTKGQSSSNQILDDLDTSI